jgi:tripartite-type tricarboxylate transporter receptor subunit TctC
MTESTYRWSTAVLFALLIWPSMVAAQQSYPTKPIRVVTTEPGSSLDLTARYVAQGISGPLGQQVIVDNRRVNSIEIVAKAQPDGYTLLAYGSPIWIMPMLREVTFDPVKDFAPITLAATSPNVLAIHPAVAATSVKELIALAKSRPGALNYGSSVTGGTPHLAAELFKSLAGVDVVRVAYKGVAVAVTDLIGGQLQMMFPVVPSAIPHVKTGKLRALAVSSAQPSALAPGLSTMAASGLPGYELVAVYGMFAPARTPVALLERLNREMVRGINTPEMKAQFLIAGAEVVGSTQQAFAAFIKADMARMSKVIKDAGIRED